MPSTPILPQARFPLPLDPASEATAQRQRLGLFAPTSLRFEPQPAASPFKPNLGTGLLAGIRGAFNAAQDVEATRYERGKEAAAAAMEKERVGLQRESLGIQKEGLQLSRDELMQRARANAATFAKDTGVPYGVAWTMFSTAAADPSGGSTDKLFDMAITSYGLHPIAKHYFGALQSSNNPDFDPLKMQDNLAKAGQFSMKLLSGELEKNDIELEILKLQRSKLEKEEKAGFLSPEAALRAGVDYNQLAGHAEALYNQEIADFAKALEARGSIDFSQLLLSGDPEKAREVLSATGGAQNKDKAIRRQAQRLLGLLEQADYFYTQAARYTGEQAPRVSSGAAFKEPAAEGTADLSAPSPWLPPSEEASAFGAPALGGVLKPLGTFARNIGGAIGKAGSIIKGLSGTLDSQIVSDVYSTALKAATGNEASVSRLANNINGILGPDGGLIENVPVAVRKQFWQAALETYGPEGMKEIAMRLAIGDENLRSLYDLINKTNPKDLIEISPELIRFVREERGGAGAR